MSGVAIIAGGREWRFWPDVVPTPAARHQVIAFAQLIDELTDAPPRAPVQVSTSIAGLSAKGSAGGFVGVSGRPAALYPNPWPAVSPSISFEIAADGFLPLSLSDSLPAQPGFPTDFVRRDFGFVLLRRQPTRISGRAVDALGAPVAAATVSVTGVWMTVDAISGAAAPPNGLSLTAGLYADRPVGATVRSRALSLLASPKKLMEPVPAGAIRLKLSDRQALVVGEPLAIEPGDAERTEYAPVGTIDAASSADQPAWITLQHPLARAHAAGVDVHRTALAAPGPANQLVSGGRGGDVTLLTDGLAGFTPAQPTLQITGGAPFDEYHGFALWRVATGPDGRFALPPIHRLAHIELTASGGGQPQPARRVVSLSGAPEMTADLIFS